jgi:hypothetical protein
MTNLAHLTERIQYHHQKAVEHWGRTLYHAWWCGKYLQRMKDTVGHGNFGGWLHRCFPKSERMARYYLRLARLYRSPPDDTAPLTLRDALNAVTRGKPRPVKKFDAEALLRASAFRAFLAIAWKGWERDEIEYLRFNLAFDPDLEEMVVSAMKKLHHRIQEEMGKAITRKQWEAARLNLHRRIWANVVN